MNKIKIILKAFKSVMWAMVGIQKKETLVADLEYTEKSGPWLFIIVGIVMTVAFVLVIISIVNLVLP